MKVVVFTDNKTCSYCKRAKAALESFAAWCRASSIVYVPADRSADKDVYDAAKRVYGWPGGSYPSVCVIGPGGKTLLRFVARNMAAAKIAARVKPYCDGCQDAPSAPVSSKPAPAPAPRKTARKKRWFSLLVIGLSLCLGSGCVISRANFRPAQAATADLPATPPELRVWRGAVLYPFKLSGLEFDTHGLLRLGGYETDGGAAGVCTVIDSSGKIIGTISASAAKAAIGK